MIGRYNDNTSHAEGLRSDTNEDHGISEVSEMTVSALVAGKSTCINK